MRPTTLRTSAHTRFVEPLESRALLAADLAVLSASTTNLAGIGAKTGALTIKNTGTVPMSGPVTVTFVATAVGMANQTLGTATVTLANLKPNATKPVTGVNLSAPNNAGSSGVVFNIVARITPRTTPADTAAGNNFKAAGTVTPTSAGSAVSPFGIQGSGTKLNFKKTKSLAGNGVKGYVHESGTFTDDKGRTGTYSLALPADGTASRVLELDFKSSGSFAGGSRRYTLKFTPASKRLNAGLNGKAVTFTAAPAGTSATATPTGTALPPIYLKY